MAANLLQAEVLRDRPFVAISYSYKPHVDQIAAQLAQSGIPVFLCSPHPNLNARCAVPLIPIPMWSARFLPNLRVFCSLDNPPYPLPPTTTRVHLPHALVLHETERALVDWWWAAFPFYDYFLLADNIAEIESPAGAQEIRDTMKWYAANSPASHRCGWYRDHQSQHVTLCAAGYPSIEMMGQASMCAEPENAIVYAPVGVAASGGPPNATLELIGEALLDALLTHLPETTVIFRPFPSDRTRECVQRIISRFRHHPRFELDCSQVSWTALARTRVLVTDTSLIKHTYAYGALRPSVCIDAREPDAPASASRLRRTHLGYVTHSVEEAVAAVGDALATSMLWRNELEVTRDRVLAFPGSASARIAELLADLYAGRPVGGRRIALPGARKLSAAEAVEFLDSPLTRALPWELVAAMVAPVLREFAGDSSVDAASRALFAIHGVTGRLL